MKCPFCGFDDTIVKDSHARKTCFTIQMKNIVMIIYIINGMKLFWL